MKTFTIVEPVFKTEPLFIGNCTRDEAKQYLSQRFKVGADIPVDCGGTMLTYGCAPWRVVWVQKMSRDPRHLCVVLHEIFHLVTRICADRGIPIVAHHPDGMNGDETAAYLFEFFARAALRKMRPTR